MGAPKQDGHDIYLVLHGHFYQPPRENPWLEAIEREPSAHPYQNWNARIADECYRTNGWARVFDEKGRVRTLLNNYVYLSFNFGPTLLSWLEQHQPVTYARILEADWLSRAAHGGHGNAIAQAYGHAILPLCNDRDRLTQIRWGKHDFVSRFGREPEAMWLPETAVDERTMEDLISEGMRYVILAPKQAGRVRPLGSRVAEGAERSRGAGERGPEQGGGGPEHGERGSEHGDRGGRGAAPGDWSSVSGAKIDPRHPYRYFSRRDPSRSIDVFFYDGPVSHGISFEKVLDSSRQLCDRFWGAVDQGRRGPQLVHAAVDGETFGHHMHHAERALSYAFLSEMSSRGFRLTNYGEYLEHHPPTWEVALEGGPENEGTAWSCSHGVGRWCRDCGCHASAPSGWNQGWRAPLRKAVELVRDSAAELFIELGGELLRDPWEARDHYIELLLDTRPASRERFLERHGKAGGRMGRQVRTLKLLEMERHSLLAQTSCGWFFNDISGLEAVQVMKYAARTVQLLEELSGRNVERPLLELLGEARSNIPHVGTGADVYRRLVLPTAVTPIRLVALYATCDAVRDFEDDESFLGYHLQRTERHLFSNGPLSMRTGRVQLEFVRTGESWDLAFALIHFGGHDFHCAVRPFADLQQYRAFIERVQQIFDRATITELLRAVDAHFGETYFGIDALLPEQREEVLDALFHDLTEHFAELYTRLYHENRRAVSALADTGLKIPREFRMAAEYTLSRQLNQEIRRQQKSRSAERYGKAMEIVAEARQRGYQLDLSEGNAIFGEMLAEALKRLVAEPSGQGCRQAADVIDLADLLRIELPLDGPQEILFDRLQGPAAGSLRAVGEPMAELLDKMHFAPGLLSAAGDGHST